MKRSLLIIALAGLGFTGLAQTEKGRVMVGAGINFGNTVTEDFNVTNGEVSKRVTNSMMNFNIRGGFFLSDNFMLGIVFGMDNSMNKTESLSPLSTNVLTSKNSGISVGPFIRMYKMLGTSKFALFGQGALTYGTGNNTSTNESTSGGVTTSIETKGDNNVTSIRVHPGITYFLTNTLAFESYFGNVGLDLSGNKNYDKDGKQVNGSKSTNLNTRLNLNLATIYVALNFYFGGSGGGSKAPANP